MRRMSWAGFLWPGAGQAWIRGNWAGLAAALGLVVLLNAALIGTFGWTELLSPAQRNALWVVLGMAWLVLVVYFGGGGARAEVFPAASADAAFRQAQGHYLKGDWLQAERLLTKTLADRDQDVECRLLLASVYRRMHRPDEARQELDRLERQDASRKWGMEIRRERELLAQAGGPECSTTAARDPGPSGDGAASPAGGESAGGPSALQAA